MGCKKINTASTTQEADWILVPVVVNDPAVGFRDARPFQKRAFKQGKAWKASAQRNPVTATGYLVGLLGRRSLSAKQPIKTTMTMTNGH